MDRIIALNSINVFIYLLKSQHSINQYRYVNLKTLWSYDLDCRIFYNHHHHQQQQQQYHDGVVITAQCTATFLRYIILGQYADYIFL